MSDSYFGDEYLIIADDEISPPRSDCHADFISTLLDLQPGMRVLDLCCGHGRIANRLAAAGAEVVGVDAERSYIERARADATRAGLKNISYELADMRTIDVYDEFDGVLSWFISFGYFDDATNRNILARIRRALRPEGRFVLELNAMHHVMRHWEPRTTREYGHMIVTDERRWDPQTGFLHKTRKILDAAGERHYRYQIRLFAFTELATWLRECGFVRIAVFGEDLTPFSRESRRMIIRADVD